MRAASTAPTNVWGKDIFTTRDYREILAAQGHRRRHRRHARPLARHASPSTPWTPARTSTSRSRWCRSGRTASRSSKPRRKTGRILQVGSQRVSSVVYKKAQDLLRSRRHRRAQHGRGVVGSQLRHRRLAVLHPARRHAREHRLGPLPRLRAQAPLRSHPPLPLAQLSGLRHRRRRRSLRPPLLRHALRHRRHRARRASSPPAACASGKTAATCPTSCSASTTTPKPPAHPAFNLALRVNFVNGAGETSGFRFIGSEGVMTIGNGVTLTRTPLGDRARHTRSAHFDSATQELIAAEYRKKYPPQKATCGRHAARPATSAGTPRAATAISTITTPTSSTPSAPASRSSRTRSSASAPPVRRCSPTSATAQGKIIQWDPNTMRGEGGERIMQSPTTKSRSHSSAPAAWARATSATPS